LTSKVKRGIYDFPSPWWDNISPMAIELIRNCLTVDPSKRYTINQFLADPWIRVIFFSFFEMLLQLFILFFN